MQQELFDFGLEGRIRQVRDRLRATFGELLYSTSRDPMSTLIKSIISSRTRDEVSLRAFNNLVQRCPTWQGMAQAAPGEIAAAIADVTHAEVKAVEVLQTLAHVAARFPDYDLAPLGDEPMEAALAWIRSLPGAGPKVAAAVMNFSTLEREAFVMDTHVLRVFRRFGLVGRKTADQKAYDLVMSVLTAWTAAQLSELHVLVKRLGQAFCHAGRRECRACPLHDGCLSATYV